MSSLRDQAQHLADLTGTPAWVCRPVRGEPFVTADPQRIPACYDGLQKVLPRGGYRSGWQPPGILARLKEV